MTSATYPTLYNVRTLSDIKVIEDDALERYDISKNWLAFELLGLSAMFDTFISNEESGLSVTAAIPKKPYIDANLVNMSIPLFLRL